MSIAHNLFGSCCSSPVFQKPYQDTAPKCAEEIAAFFEAEMRI